MNGSCIARAAATRGPSRAGRGQDDGGQDVLRDAVARRPPRRARCRPHHRPGRGVCTRDQRVVRARSRVGVPLRSAAAAEADRLRQAPTLVVCHRGYELALDDLTVEETERYDRVMTFGTRQRGLVIIDESLDQVYVARIPRGGLRRVLGLAYPRRSSGSTSARSRFWSRSTTRSSKRRLTPTMSSRPRPYSRVRGSRWTKRTPRSSSSGARSEA